MRLSFQDRAAKATPSRPERFRHDGDTQAWVVSVLVHGAMLALFASLTIRDPSAEPALLLSTVRPVEESPLLDSFHFSDDWQEVEIGASALVPAAAPERADEPRIPEPEIASELARVEVTPLDAPPEAPTKRLDAVVPGAAGVGVTDALGAIDRITQEILLSLQQRRTLVVWIFDQSGSMQRQRSELLARFDRIYQELGIIEASGNPAFARHNDKPLLSAVMAFGERNSYRTAKPTDDLEEIKAAVAGVETDPSSPHEFVFEAIHDAAKRFHTYRVSEPRRNVMIVVFTDEAGDDIHRLDQAVLACRKYEIPVYIVGVPAPFGREESMVKYVDPDPNFDQSPQEAPVHQGPESVMAEHLRLHFSGSGQRDEAIDSGFGPYGLTRLCVETGGIYFGVHPNRETGRRVTIEETAVLAPYLARFFDPTIMRAYRPDYVSTSEYQVLLERNKACAALVQAASLSWVTPMESITRSFPKQNEAELASLLSQAQQAAAKLEPKIRQIFEILRLGVPDRPKITALRWQAGFDLAMGRVLAVKVRTEAYNAMLAQAKRGMEFSNPHSDTWVLKPANTISVGSALEKQAEDSRQYLQRIVRDHQGTPWHYLAQKELRQPLGWEWSEAHTGVRQPAESPAGGEPRMPRDDQILRLEKPKPKRPPPAL